MGARWRVGVVSFGQDLRALEVVGWMLNQAVRLCVKIARVFDSKHVKSLALW